MGCVYFRDNKNTVPVYIDTLVKASGQVGTLIGQLFFGYLADRYGRKKMYGIELMIILIGTIGSALSSNLQSGFSVFAVLGLWRIFMGIGIGGDYPLSAIITAEFATTKHRGAMMAAVFAMQGFGILVAATVAIIFLLIFKNLVNKDVNNLDHVWRLCIAFGVIPCLAAIYFRLTIPETPRYTMQVENNMEKAVNDVKFITTGEKVIQDVATNDQQPQETKASWQDFKKHFGQWKNLKVLLGTSISWFALDVGFYGINLNTGIIVEAIGYSGSLEKDNVWDVLFKNSVGNIIIALMGTVPGYWFSVGLIEILGRKKIQIIGFVFLGVILLVLGVAYEQIKHTSIALFIVLFTLMQFFQNFGPNTTTFIIPGEVFPTRYRSTAHGISAAMGKLGAIISQVGLFQIKDIGGKNAQIPLLLIIFSVFMLIGLLFTFLLPETKGKTLEELSNEDGEPETKGNNHF